MKGVALTMVLVATKAVAKKAEVAAKIALSTEKITSEVSLALPFIQDELKASQMVKLPTRLIHKQPRVNHYPSSNIAAGVMIDATEYC